MDKRTFSLTFLNLREGIQEVSLDITQLYSSQEAREKFEERLCQFLSSDPANSKIFRREDNLLIYRTEQIISEKRDARPPLLLLFGNPASHSVTAEMFFAFEGSGREHRIWKVFNKTGFLRFNSDLKPVSKADLELRNRLRKKDLFELSYNSPFRIGLAVFYSMPSAASSGVDGLRQLFGSDAFIKISESEKNRVEEIIHTFVSLKGAVIAFQKDAYSGIKSPTSPIYDKDEAKEGNLVGNCQCNQDVRLFCSPPTRIIQGNKSLGVLGAFKQIILGS